MGHKLDQMRKAVGSKPPVPRQPAKTTASDGGTPTPAGHSPCSAERGDSAKSNEPAILTFRCGHTDVLANFTHQDCPRCKSEKKRKKNADKLAAKQAEQAEEPARGRLPKGSTFVAVWDGQEWAGTLAVMGIPELNEQRRAGGVRPLLHLMRLLDDDYRTMAPNEEAIRAADAVVNGREPD